MTEQVIIHFANIFERANFDKIILPNSPIKKLTPNFCLMDRGTNPYTYVIKKHCPNSRIIIKRTKNKRTTYTEWRP